MSNLTTLPFKDHSIRVVDRDGNPWFSGGDVLTMLYGTANGKGHIYDRLAADERCRVSRTHLGMAPGKDVILVSESGLYNLVLRSDKASVKPYRDWVTRTVLPAIRKDGAYVQGEEKVASGEMSEDEFLLKAFEILKRKAERLAAENAAMTKELNLLTVDEFRALNHAYWPHSTKVRLGQEASYLCRVKSIPVEKQRRPMTIRGQNHVAVVNVYPRSLLSEAAAMIGVSAT